MEGGEKQKSCSLTNDPVGAKGSSDSSSSRIFNTIFPPPTKEPFHFLDAEKKKNDFGSQESKTESSGNIRAIGVENNNQNMSEKDKNAYPQDEKSHPCHYSSSIYYGGQDVLTQPDKGHSSTATTFNKDDGEDDNSAASRGNWWQGSLYY